MYLCIDILDEYLFLYLYLTHTDVPSTTAMPETTTTTPETTSTTGKLNYKL